MQESISLCVLDALKQRITQLPGSRPVRLGDDKLYHREETIADVTSVVRYVKQVHVHDM